MDLKFDKRQSKRYKEKQNKEFNGKYCKNIYEFKRTI